MGGYTSYFYFWLGGASARTNEPAAGGYCSLYHLWLGGACGGTRVCYLALVAALSQSMATVNQQSQSEATVAEESQSIAVLSYCP